MKPLQHFIKDKTSKNEHTVDELMHAREELLHPIKHTEEMRLEKAKSFEPKYRRYRGKIIRIEQ